MIFSHKEGWRAGFWRCFSCGLILDAVLRDDSYLVTCARCGEAYQFSCTEDHIAIERMRQ